MSLAHHYAERALQFRVQQAPRPYEFSSSRMTGMFDDRAVEDPR